MLRAVNEELQLVCILLWGNYALGDLASFYLGFRHAWLCRLILGYVLLLLLLVIVHWWLHLGHWMWTHYGLTIDDVLGLLLEQFLNGIWV